MILADNGSPWFISGAPSRGWSNDDLHELRARARRRLRGGRHLVAAAARAEARRRGSRPAPSSRTSSPTAIRPPATMSARRPPRSTRPFSTPGLVSFSRWPHGSHSRLPTHSTSPTVKRRPTRSLRRDAAGDARCAAPRRGRARSRPRRASALDRLGLDQRQVLAGLALLVEGAVAGEVAVALDALPGDHVQASHRRGCRSSALAARCRCPRRSRSEIRSLTLGYRPCPAPSSTRTPARSPSSCSTRTRRRPSRTSASSRATASTTASSSTA